MGSSTGNEIPLGFLGGIGSLAVVPSPLVSWGKGLETSEIGFQSTGDRSSDINGAILGMLFGAKRCGLTDSDTCGTEVAVGLPDGVLSRTRSMEAFR